MCQSEHWGETARRPSEDICSCRPQSIWAWVCACRSVCVCAFYTCGCISSSMCVFENACTYRVRLYLHLQVCMYSVYRTLMGEPITIKYHYRAERLPVYLVINAAGWQSRPLCLTHPNLLPGTHTTAQSIHMKYIYTARVCVCLCVCLHQTEHRVYTRWQECTLGKSAFVPWNHSNRWVNDCTGRTWNHSVSLKYSSNSPAPVLSMYIQRPKKPV